MSPLHFTSCSVLIETHNARTDASFTLGHNEFSDMTHAEFRERMRLGEFSPGLTVTGGKRFNFLEFDEEEETGGGEMEVGNGSLRGATEAATATERRLQSSSETADDADEMDWHTKGLMGPVRSQ